MPILRSAPFVTGILALCLYSMFASADTPTFEDAPQLTASKVLPGSLLRSAHYTIRDTVTWNGFLFQFEIESKFGLFRAGSRHMLERRLHEIQTMGKLVSATGGNAYFEGLQRRLVQLPTSLVGAVTKPVQTVAAVPQALSKTFGRIGGLFGSKGGQGGVSANPAALKASLVATEKRKVAKELGVDPYSRNAKLQQLLEEVATERYVGGLTVSLGSYAIPTTAVYTAASTQLEITDMLSDLTVDELRKQNAAVLSRMGVHGYLANAYLASTVATPSQQTVLVSAVSKLSGVYNKGAILEAALQARDETHAAMQVEQAVALSRYHRTKERFTRMVAVGGIVVALTQSGTAFVLAPIDGAYWDQHAQAVIQAMQSSPLMKEASRRVLCVKGLVTKNARQAIEAQGLRLAGWPFAVATK